MHLCSIDWGVHLPSIYMHCPRSSSGCSGMQGICAQLTGEGHMQFNSIQSIYAWLTGGSICLLYMHCPRSSSGCSSMQGICAWLTREGHMKCKSIQGIYAWLTGGSICLLYICIVLDLAVGVAVYKASVLDWLGGPSAFYIYVLS